MVDFRCSRLWQNGEVIDVKQWREQHRLTQRELANLLDLDPQTISRWERGVKQPRGRVLELALRALDQDLNSREETAAR